MQKCSEQKNGVDCGVYTVLHLYLVMVRILKKGSFDVN